MGLEKPVLIIRETSNEHLTKFARLNGINEQLKTVIVFHRYYRTAYFQMNFTVPGISNDPLVLTLHFHHNQQISRAYHHKLLHRGLIVLVVI